MLDAWAVLALLRDEPAAERVEALIDDGEAVMSSVNLGEVLYTLIRGVPRHVAGDLVDGVRQAVGVAHPDWPLVEAAARIKAGGGLSYADAFCLATGEAEDAPVATGDPEMLSFAGAAELIDLRTGRAESA